MKREAPAAAASDFDGVTQARAVWDFTTGDETLFLDRLLLIRSAADIFRGAGATNDFVLLLHGPVMKFVVKDLSRTSFVGEEIANSSQIRDLLSLLHAGGARIEVCRVSMRRRGVDENNLLEFCTVEENVFANSIALQNRGYAVMHTQ